ncbi:Vps51/Vps67-domain-containing protein [Lipomyces arxii]|uniref:Vps51/Vps67-domain-containing protein n=1 Tax=Lipomyces arxii TaxID=56418 RepID=UPI0034CF9AE2
MSVQSPPGEGLTKFSTPRSSTDSVNTLRSVSSTAPNGSVHSQRGTPVRSSAATARRNALREFYAIGQDRYRAGISASDIDRPDFKPDLWIDRFVREHKAKDLLHRENKIMHEIRTLDGEGKALVYDNYSKLISATEAIQSMRVSMDPLQPTTTALEPAVAHIAEVSTTLIATLSERRRKLAADEVQSDVEVSKDVLKVLKTLVDAPSALSRLIDNGERAKAQAYWNTLEPALEKLEHVKGVNKIKEDCKSALGEPTKE